MNRALSFAVVSSVACILAACDSTTPRPPIPSAPAPVGEAPGWETLFPDWIRMTGVAVNQVTFDRANKKVTIDSGATGVEPRTYTFSTECEAQAVELMVRTPFSDYTQSMDGTTDTVKWSVNIDVPSGETWGRLNVKTANHADLFGAGELVNVTLSREVNMGTPSDKTLAWVNVPYPFSTKRTIDLIQLASSAYPRCDLTYKATGAATLTLKLPVKD